MNCELLFQNRESGITWDLTNLTETATYTTHRTGSPGTFTFSLASADQLNLHEGDPVRFTVDGQVIFYGYVFSRSVNEEGVLDVTCYDQLRYLKNKSSYAFYGLTAGQMIQQIAEDYRLDVGELFDTGYALPSYIKEDQTCLDIISGAVQQTLLHTGRIFVFYDDAGKLTLQPADAMFSEVVLGEGSMMTGYTYQVDIDTQTYNQVTLLYQNGQAGRTERYTYYNSDTINRWGLLQYSQTVDESQNPAQVQAQAKEMLKYFDKPTRSFSANALGVPGLRAGQMVYLHLPQREIAHLALLESVTHTFEQNSHTMSIETLALDKGVYDAAD